MEDNSIIYIALVDLVLKLSAYLDDQSNPLDIEEKQFYEQLLEESIKLVDKYQPQVSGPIAKPKF